MVIYNIRGENIEVTPAIRDYVESKVGKIEKYFKNELNADAHVNLKTYPEKTAKVEVTIPLPNIVLRAEETSPDLYGSINQVSDKLERQIRKYKTKINRRNRNQAAAQPEPVNPDLWSDFDLSDIDPNTAEEEDDGISESIVRTKRLNLKPMSPEEAVLQMDMLGHSFFIFEDAETNGINVVYKRNDGLYGLLETD